MADETPKPRWRRSGVVLIMCALIVGLSPVVNAYAPVSLLSLRQPLVIIGLTATALLIATVAVVTERIRPFPDGIALLVTGTLVAGMSCAVTGLFGHPDGVVIATSPDGRYELVEEHMHAHIDDDSVRVLLRTRGGIQRISSVPIVCYDGLQTHVTVDFTPDGQIRIAHDDGGGTMTGAFDRFTLRFPMRETSCS